MAVIELSHPSISPLRLVARSERVVIGPGRIFATADPVTVIATVGAGVAVCLWDYAAKVGGIAHYLLPATNGWERAIRCGTGAIPALLERVIALGARPDRLNAKIFGGARSIPDGECAHGPMNVKTALETLNHAGIRIVAADLEGDRARRLVFHVEDGRTWVRQI